MDVRFAGDIHLARRLRHRQTLTEAIVGSWLRARRFGEWKFRRQHPIASYVLDFYCDELKLAVEVDGRGHSTDCAGVYDLRRERFLATLGVAIARIRAANVIRDRDGVGEILAGAIAMRAALTRRFAAPSPRGRG